MNQFKVDRSVGLRLRASLLVFALSLPGYGYGLGCMTSLASTSTLRLVTEPRDYTIQDLVLQYPREIEELVRNGDISVSVLQSSVVMTGVSRKTQRAYQFVFLKQQTEEGGSSLVPLFVLSKKPRFIHHADTLENGRVGFHKTVTKRWGTFSQLSLEKDGPLFDLINGNLLKFTPREDAPYGANELKLQIIPGKEMDLARLFED